MKRALAILAILLVLIAAGVALAPALIPTETYKSQIAAQVRAATGRDLRIEGPLSFSLFPRLALRAEDVTFAGPEGAEEPAMVELPALELDLELLPLLRGDVIVERLVLDEPTIRLRTDAQGRGNWVLDVEQPQEAPTEESAGEPDGGSYIRSLTLDEVRVVDGTVIYADASGEEVRLNDVDLEVSLPEAESALALDGALTWNGERVRIAGRAARPSALLSGEPSPVTLEAAAPALNLTFEGEVTTNEPFRARGDLALAVPSPEGFSAWTGQPFLPPQVGAVKLEGGLEASPNRVALSPLTFALGEASGRGNVTLAFAAKPSLAGDLAIDRLDLNRYLQAAADEAPPQTDAAGAPSPAPAGQAPAGEARETPIDLSGLAALDADLSLSAGAVRYDEIETGQADLVLRLQDGRLTAELKRASLYGGTASGTLTAEQAGAAPSFAADLAAEGLQAEPLLRDAAETGWLAGTAAAQARLAAQGVTSQALLASLDGEGSATFRDGAIKGVNLAAMARNVTEAFQNAEAGAPQQTDFSELSGTFRIENGVARNDDMVLRSPFLRLRGAGSANLVERRLDYRIEPTLVPTIEGQGGRDDVAGLTVPVIIEGPWDDLSYRPDLAGLVRQGLEDPERVREAAEQARESLKRLEDEVSSDQLKGALEGAARRALGGQGSGEGEPASDPLKTLQNLFGRE